MSAREQILTRLRQTQVPAQTQLPDVAGWFNTHQRHETTPERVTRLKAALEAVHTEIHDVTHDNWTQTLMHLVISKGLRHLLIGTDTPHGAQLQACQPSQFELVTYDRPINAWQDLLFDGIDAALTSAQGAVAETGSLIVWPTPNEPRLMSLVPSTHFVLLDADTIFSDFYSAMTQKAWSKSMPTNALLICGPSKTADIQQTLAYGAHGPRELVVLLRHSTGAHS